MPDPATGTPTARHEAPLGAVPPAPTPAVVQVPAQRPVPPPFGSDPVPSFGSAPAGSVAEPPAAGNAEPADVRTPIPLGSGLTVPAPATGTAGGLDDSVLPVEYGGGHSPWTNEAVDRVGEAVDWATATSGRVASGMVDRLRNNAELAAERGTTTIADEVVEKIVGISARDVEGVHDLGGDVARAFAAVKERIGLGRAEQDSDRGISVRLEGDRAEVDITLVVEYGAVVKAVTEAVRVKVIEAVEHMLNLRVTEVNIVVDDIHVPD